MRVAGEETALKEEVARLTRELEGLKKELAKARSELGEHEIASGQNERQLERYAADLRETFKEERSRSQELQRSYMATVRALSNAVEARDAYTGKHAERVTAYGLEVARAIGQSLAFGSETEFGFLLHDVGKVAIPDAILYKPDPPPDQQRALMDHHPLIHDHIIR